MHGNRGPPVLSRSLSIVSFARDFEPVWLKDLSVQMEMSGLARLEALKRWEIANKYILYKNVYNYMVVDQYSFILEWPFFAEKNIFRGSFAASSRSMVLQPCLANMSRNMS